MAERGLLERLQERTQSHVRQIPRGPAYNVPDAWYMTPRGEILKLQGDAWNRAYYEDMGCAYLRPDEVREWEQDIRPKVIAEQRRKAALINACRRIAAKNEATKAMVADAVHDDTTIPELEEVLKDLGKATNTPVNVYLKRETEALEARELPDSEARGVEIGTAEAFQAKIARGQARPGGPRRDQTTMIEGTGYDPFTGKANA